MSRTVKGKKAPGQEFWSPRPGNKHGGLMGSFAKRRTHHVERQQGKQDARVTPEMWEGLREAARLCVSVESRRQFRMALMNGQADPEAIGIEE